MVYDPSLVLLSAAVAFLATYTALDLVGRIRAAHSDEAWGWLLAGACSMGSGIWAMHFVGMLACEMPFERGYRIDLTIVSWLLAAMGSLVTLYLASATTLTQKRYYTGVACMTVAIVSMHYVGMAAMDMRPAIAYDPFWVVASILVALVGCGTGLHIAFNLRAGEAFKHKVGAAILIGIAILGVHYLGMHAADFAPGSVSGAANSISDRWLALLTANTSLLVLACMLTAITLDRRMEARTSEYVQSLQMANLKLHHASRHDSLTDLGNRVLLREQLDIALARAEAQDGEFALLSIDLDNFKSLNDTLGHDHGDEILRKTGDALRKAVRTQDTAVRMGGDEFMLLVTAGTRGDDLHGLCERLLAAVRGIGNARVHFTASIGVARYPADGDTAPAILKSTDLALYNAKQSGKDRYALYSPKLAEGVARDFAIQNELSAAIAAGEIRPYYQPKYDMQTRRVVGAEALARWHHPRDGMISPGRFIAIAERSNQIGALQVSMLRQVCADMRRWRAQGLTVSPIAFNLSALCLRNVDLPQLIEETLREYGLSPGDLICEVTETEAIPELEHTLRTLRGLRERSIRIALDDFGTGLSSMSYLRDLPIDQLKIDRAFVSRLTVENDHESMIVDAILNLARSLNLSVVAEGVENEEQFQKLRQMRCDQVQGFLFSPAVSGDAFVSFLEPRSTAKVIALR